jgi:hypothetical protein
MKMPTEQAIKLYSDACQKWETMKRENKLMKGDIEPSGKDYGLLPSVAEFIKGKIQRETHRQ